jgi:hypothetical protein
MEKTKTWITDRLTVNEFQSGDTMLVRRKKNGHPRAIKDNTPYKIKRIENDCLVLFQSDGSVSATLFRPKQFKVHFSYFLNTQTVRDEIINELLKD